ncbi:hypothetical protein RvY_01576-2 [Ramazzottius varieornatus]|uniref:Amine oxidase domain-containing protein n=1 Tax=Ramazzottius varieornatus TaxID=947166 RepID=A0A1D1UHN3_RAMVA|nr:hypothetical protein RvY_01576-2 [Ramazzottius varieornatus]
MGATILATDWSNYAISSENNLSRGAVLSRQFNKWRPRVSSAPYIADAVYNYIIQKERAEYGVDSLSNLSFAHSFAPFDSSEVSLNISMMEFLRQIAPLADSAVKINMKVDKIVLNGSNTGRPMLVYTSSNVTFSADHVIVTVSLGHLKANIAALFDPPLSERKREAIRLAGFGTRERIVLVYNTSWWRAVWPEMKNGVKVGILKNLQPEAELLLSAWTASIAEFSEDTHIPNALQFEFSLDAESSVENVTDASVQDDLTVLLRTITPNVTIMELPVAIYRDNWERNRLSAGTHSFFAVELATSAQNLSFLDLASPDPAFGYSKHLHGADRLVPGLLFAGEHTHPSLSSTVPGAILSGFREANRLAMVYT